ncbi:MAG TPA: glycosyltransferase family 9 protein [bacterium]|nr:glycosyltransferase family 9 protein [bacterium]
MSKIKQLKQSCRFFMPEVPCVYHKMAGKKCPDCDRYSPIKEKILIIKLGALGDVLRTTSICEPLKDLYPESVLFWITEDNHVPVLEGNHFVDRIINKSNAINFVSFFTFDLVINLDLDEDALIFAGIVKSKEKRGFWYDSSGKIHCSNQSAETYFLMSHDDQLKKRNKKTYQRFIAEIAGLSEYGNIIVPISEASKKNAEEFAKRYGLNGKKVLGAVIGTGNRWITKRWPEKHFLDLFSRLDDFEILIFGGAEEKDLLEQIVKKSNLRVINTGHSNSIDLFFGLLNLCDIVVCCDTFALHAAVGLGKKTIALFGPTSSNEVEMYNHGVKIVSPAWCVCCYKKTCSTRPMCMELITPRQVEQFIRRVYFER